MRRRCCWSTGGAGCIGSNVVASLNEAGRTDIAVNDILSTGQKWRNLVGRRLAEFEPAGDLVRAGTRRRPLWG
jgi:ADP-L-glycero-D-manno-heptose 6-epimerase